MAKKHLSVVCLNADNYLSYVVESCGPHVGTLFLVYQLTVPLIHGNHHTAETNT